MQIAEFVYRQQELAQRGAGYEVDEFRFDAEWTEPCCRCSNSSTSAGGEWNRAA